MQSSQPMQLFTYSPLSGSSTTRVVMLKPAANLEDPIHCRLEEVSLNDEVTTPPTYEALSYVWGDTGNTCPIIFPDGGVVFVTPNCKAALRYLRHTDHERALWVDALCIDQQSAPDKAFQIPLMDSVFAMAVKVIICLGVGGDDITSMFRYLNRGESLAKRYYTMSMHRRRLLNPIRWLWNRIHQDRKCIELLASADWFWRIWTVQEQYFAQDSLLVLGHTQCSYESFRSYVFWCRSERGVPLAFRQRNLFSTQLDFLMDESRKRELDHLEVDRFLPWWLALTRAGNTSTDPHDTVYALLGILRRHWPHWPHFPVNYNLSLALVYEEFAKYIVRHTGTLDVLVGKDAKLRNKTPLEGLPDWVPDMRGVVVGANDSEIKARMAFLPAIGLATLQSVIDIPTLDQSLAGEIRVRGCRIDNAGSEPAFILSQNLREIYEWKQACLAAGLEVPQKEIIPSRLAKNSVVKKLVRELCVWGINFLFLTAQNRIGVAGFDVQDGDIMVLLLGYNCPVALRQCKDKTYTFMGRVALQGAMLGEMWDTEKDVSDLEIFALV